VAWYTDDGTFAPAPAVRRAVAEAGGCPRGARRQGARLVAPDAARARDLFFGVLGADGFATSRRALGKDRRDRRIAAIEMALRSKRIADLALG
jgi:fatty acid amide hydrolase